MQDIKVIYEQLTGVNIDEQKRLWDERGKGYYGEYLVFHQLFHNVSGHCKILMNLNLPVQHDRTTEVDLLLIHETGIYVFEVKHYKGDIYGNIDDETWTQYFRTAKNNVFQNPVVQNAYHIKALSAILPNVPIYSCIVFTNDNGKLHITGTNPNIIVTRDRALMYRLDEAMTGRTRLYTMQQINQLFTQLCPYSPLQQETVSAEGIETPFYDYLATIRQELLVAKERFEKETVKLEQEREQLRSKSKSAFQATQKYSTTSGLPEIPPPPSIQDTASPETFHGEYSIGVQQLSASRMQYISAIENAKKAADSFKKKSTVVLVYCLIITALFCTFAWCAVQRHFDDRLSAYQAEYNNKLDVFEQKFLRIEDIDNDLISSVNNMIGVSNVTLNASPDISDAVVFSCTLTNNSEKYGITLNRDSQYIVTTADGMTYEYPVFGEHLAYFSFSNQLGPYHSKSGTLKEATFTKISSVQNVIYIKITNVSLWEGSKSYVDIATGIDLELYSID